MAEQQSPEKKDKAETKIDPEKVIVLLKNAGKAKQLNKPKILMKRSDKLYEIIKFLRKNLGCDTVCG